MKRVKMLADHDGAKAGDVVGFESDAEADAHVAAGRAETHQEQPSEAEAQTTSADVGAAGPRK